MKYNYFAIVNSMLLAVVLFLPSTASQADIINFNWQFIDQFGATWRGMVLGLDDSIVGSQPASDVRMTFSDSSTATFIFPEDTIDGVVSFNNFSVENGMIAADHFLSDDFDLLGDQINFLSGNASITDALSGLTYAGDVSYSEKVVPEPFALILFSIGLAGLGFMRSKQAC